MSIMQRTESNGVRNRVLETIADERRRRTLDVLIGQSSPLALDDLADHLVDGGAGVSEEDSSGIDAATVRTSLVHHHFPALEAVDLLEWDREAGTVTATDHPALADPTVRRILDGDGDEDELDAVVDSIANERRRTVLAILEGRGEPTPRLALAREVTRREASGDQSPDEVEETLATLHHCHLPKLEDAGLLAYDREEETVTYRGHSELDP